LTRFIVPVWLLAGAIFKLIERNPKLLPAPVRTTVDLLNDAIAPALGMNLVQFLLFSMRSMIAVELVLVGVMFFVPKLARTAAIMILSLFCVILLAEIWGITQSRDFAKKGIAALLEPCGCFGVWSPPSIMTFAIDATMLLGVILCRPGLKGRTVPGWPISGIAGVASLVVGTGLAFGMPDRTLPASPSPANNNSPVAAPIDDKTPPATPPVTGAPSAQAATPWPAAPAKLDRTYYIVEKKALGQRLDSLPLALQINRPLPEKINSGRWHLVFYRKDCDHCFEVMNKHFSGKLATPTLAIEIPDSKGKTYPMPCKECEQHTLPKGPDYVVGAPLLMTVIDGVIVGISKDVDKPGAIEAVLSAEPGGAAVDGALIMPKVAVPTPGATATPAAAASKPFPAMPATIEAYYAPEFEKWKGKRFDEQPIAALLARPLPFDPNVGTVCVVYYRADCDHCQDLFADHFSRGNPCPTIAVSIPDTDPSAALDMPCAECKVNVLPQGPIYVIQTPVLVLLKDGVVQGVLIGEEVGDPTAVEALLPKAASAPSADKK